MYRVYTYSRDRLSLLVAVDMFMFLDIYKYFEATRFLPHTASINDTQVLVAIVVVPLGNDFRTFLVYGGWRNEVIGIMGNEIRSE